ncbi:hypothetical protein AVEN_225888-1 [Araneus ventricosus]|uniref:Uncharacterized protein n=1 Tax=Araneus ventricosus TaxID=182803 RepID=A0A4Y2BAL3_ARAVE|nr:hypothetical protein AVEN_225888-1 [Araneus ventricosus]
MSCYRINKQELASPGGIEMVGLLVPPPVIVHTSFGGGRAVAVLVTRTLASVLEAIATAVIQSSRTLRQGGVTISSGYTLSWCILKSSKARHSPGLCDMVW